MTTLSLVPEKINGCLVTSQAAFNDTCHTFASLLPRPQHFAKAAVEAKGSR